VATLPSCAVIGCHWRSFLRGLDSSLAAVAVIFCPVAQGAQGARFLTHPRCPKARGQRCAQSAPAAAACWTSSRPPPAAPRGTARQPTPPRGPGPARRISCMAAARRAQAGKPLPAWTTARPGTRATTAAQACPSLGPAVPEEGPQQGGGADCRPSVSGTVGSMPRAGCGGGATHTKQCRQLAWAGAHRSALWWARAGGGGGVGVGVGRSTGSGAASVERTSRHAFRASPIAKRTCPAHAREAAPRDGWRNG
jgi:hypothetical protein